MTTAAPERERKTDYTPEEIEHGLTVFALNARSRKRTAEQLEAEEVATPVSTIRAWADKQHKELFQKIDGEVASLRTERRRAGYEDKADRAMDIQGLALDELEHRLKDDKLRAEIKDKDLIDAASRLGITSATATDKYRLLKGEPTSIVKRDFQGTMRFLHDLGIAPSDLFDFDGEAVEEPEPPALPQATGG